jgi:O-antigen ligase
MCAVNSDSDINYIPAILGFFVAIIAIVAAFFLVGAVAGVIVLVVVLAIAVWALFKLLSENDD